MVGERYYSVEKMKERFMVDAFNINIVKQKGKNLEMLSNEAIKPEEIGVKLSNGKVFCIDDRYEIREISEKQAMQTLESMKRSSSLWQDYMSTSENIGSPHLGHEGGSLI